MLESIKETASALKALFFRIVGIYLFWFLGIIIFAVSVTIFLSPFIIITLFYENNFIIEDAYNYGLILFITGGIYALLLFHKRKYIGETLSKLFSLIPFLNQELEDDNEFNEFGYSDSKIKHFIDNWLIFILFFVVIILIRLIGC
jgi:hypothetical protein